MTDLRLLALTDDERCILDVVDTASRATGITAAAIREETGVAPATVVSALKALVKTFEMITQRGTRYYTKKERQS